MRPEIIDFSDGIPVKAYVRGGCQFPYHWHDTLEIIQVLKGSVSISFGSQELLLNKNDVVIINIDEMHRIIKGEEDNEILFIHIDSRFYRSLLPENCYLFLYCSSVYHESEMPEKYIKLREHVARLVSALNTQSCRADRKNIESILADMLNDITYSFDLLRWGFGTTPFDDKIVERLRQMAKRASSGYDENLFLKDLAAEIDISSYHLSHDIKEKFGLTFLHLLNYSKCAYAAKLLLSTDSRIIDIALECGFSDNKYLNKYFKHFFHHTPSDFRTKYKADNKTLASQALYRDLPLSI